MNDGRRGLWVRQKLWGGRELEDGRASKLLPSMAGEEERGGDETGFSDRRCKEWGESEE